MRSGGPGSVWGGNAGLLFLCALLAPALATASTWENGPGLAVFTEPGYAQGDAVQLLDGQEIDKEAQSAPKFYPVPDPTPLQVTAEDYQPKYRSLGHLRGAYFDLSNVENFASKQKTELGVELHTEIEKILAEVGFKMLTKEEAELEPGQPQFDIWPSYKPACCSLGFWANRTQGGKILADPEYNYRVGTWGDGANFLTEETSECPHLGSWIATEVLRKIRQFAEDYQLARDELAEMVAQERALEEAAVELAEEYEGLDRASREAGAMGSALVKAKRLVDLIDKANHLVDRGGAYEPAPVALDGASSATSGAAQAVPNLPQPLQCDTAQVHYFEFFQQGSYKIGGRQSLFLNDLADAMLRCTDYRFVVETHETDGGSEGAGRELSKWRAHTLETYLLARGIPPERVDMRFFGRAQETMMGGEGNEATRRVVVRPVAIN